jgi:phage-related protein
MLVKKQPEVAVVQVDILVEAEVVQVDTLVGAAVV